MQKLTVIAGVLLLALFGACSRDDSAPQIEKVMLYSDGGSHGYVFRDTDGSLIEAFIDLQLVTDTHGALFLGTTNPEEGDAPATKEEFDGLIDLARRVLAPHDLSGVYDAGRGQILDSEITPAQLNLAGVADLIEQASYPPRKVERIDGGVRTTYPDGRIFDNIEGFGVRVTNPDGTVEEYPVPLLP